MELRKILNVENWRAKYWFMSGKEDKKFDDYDLNENAIIFEIGAFTGNTTNQLWNKFECNIYAFEPIERFYKQIKEKIPNNSKIKIYNIGLSDNSKKKVFFLKDIGSSQYVVKDKDYQEFKEEICELKNIINFIDEKGINKIDLMIIDTEGSEYEILDILIKTGYIKLIKNVMIQFHKTIEDYKGRRKRIRRLLKITHKNKYTLPFVWEKWERK